MADTLNNTAVEITRGDIQSSTAQQLIAALNAELSARYPEEGANHFRLDPHEVAEGQGTFVVAAIDGEPIGCGALRQIEPGVGEIKRMFVAPTARGRGVGGLVLAELEAEALRLGLRRILLETGPRQPEAIAVYRRAGYCDIPLYGEYIHSPCPEFSVCMAKDL
jgi:putative acetyltransferase